MKKRKKIFIITMLIALILLLILYVGFKIYYHNNPITVTEMSILSCSFKVESLTEKVVLEDEEENLSSEENNSLSSSNTGSGYYRNGGSAASVSPAYYTPRIEIPRTGISYTIYSDMSVSNMNKGVVILSTANGLNQPGNTVISGHNYVNGRLFSNNYKIQEGDLIYITDSSGNRIAYSVYSKYQTSPNDAGYIDRDTGGAREISLTTCTNDSSARIIILAKEI